MKTGDRITEKVTYDKHNKLRGIFRRFHNLDHNRMKIASVNIRVQKKKLNQFVAACIFCKINAPLNKITTKTSVIPNKPWCLVHTDSIDWREYRAFNDNYRLILKKSTFIY